MGDVQYLILYYNYNQVESELKEGMWLLQKVRNTGTVVLADLTEALHEGGWDFSIQDLQNRLDIFPCSISAQITGKQTEEVCEQTHTNAVSEEMFSFIAETQVLFMQLQRGENRN